VNPHLPSGKILASDMSNGLLVLRLDGIVANEGGPEGPAGFALLPPSPNPVRAATTLRATLDAAADVRLAVYDALGREVAVLHEGPLAAGSHAVRFDPAGLPNGLYLARLDAHGRTSTQRVTVLR
jgi:hypothetical protein